MPKITQQSNKPVKKSVKGKSVLDRIQPLVEAEEDGIKMNIYGASGTGKTTLWATFPKPILVLVISGAGELRSLDKKKYGRTIDQVTIQNTNEIREVVDMCKAETKYATTVLDHASGLQDMVLKEILGLDELPAQLSWGLASQQQYGQCAMKVKEYIRALIGLPGNTVIVAQERLNTFEDTDSDLITPFVGSALSPSIATWLNPVCDYIVQTYKRLETVETQTKVGGKVITTKKKTKKVEYCLRTGPDPVYLTKFRVPNGYNLPYSIVDPTYEKIVEIIQGGS
jgi:hypothetical protein